jgi:hypothetical protein
MARTEVRGGDDESDVEVACSIASAVLALDPCAVDASSLAIVNLI